MRCYGVLPSTLPDLLAHCYYTQWGISVLYCIFNTSFAHNKTMDYPLYPKPSPEPY